MWKVFLIIGFSQAHFIHTPNRTINSCVYRHYQCNPYFDYPCCEVDNTCMPTKWNSKNVYACFKTIKLRERCYSNSDCSDNESVICDHEESVCKCSKNYMEHGNQCRPLLNGMCWTDFDCLVTYSICKDNKCECESFLVADSNNACVPTPLKHVCFVDTDCLKAKNAVCSENGLCECRGGYQEINNSTCASYLDGYCKDLIECWPEHSACVNNQCICQYGFVPVSNEKCQPSPLGKRCLDDKDCNSISDGSESTKIKYICKAHESLYYNYRCTALLKQFCLLNSECLINNSYCYDNKCDCENGFISKNDRECVPILLNKYCTIDNDCSEEKNLICSAKKQCICAEGYVEYNNYTCGSTIGNYCSKSTPCSAKNSECYESFCHCELNYWPKTPTECVPL